MSDTEAGPLDPRQRAVDRYEAMQTHLDNRQAQINTGMPGIIVSYAPATQTAKVRPAIQVMHTQISGERVPTDIAEIHDVPVQFPGGGGHTMTFPVRPGDECWLTFASRSIDAWHQHGGTQPPTDFRMHDINDAMATVGIRSQAKKLANVSGTTTQLRSDDGNTVIDIDGAGGAMTLSAPNGIVLNTPVVTVNGIININGGAGDVGVFSGSLAVTGEVIARHGASPVGLSTHHHPAINAPPTPGTE